MSWGILLSLPWRQKTIKQEIFSEETPPLRDSEEMVAAIDLVKNLPDGDLFKQAVLSKNGLSRVKLLKN